jgi:hypothetical protein
MDMHSMEQAIKEANHHPEHDANGRFVPGQSGNPSGKRPGTRNRATVLRETLREGEDAGVARVVIDKALAGNAVMARFVIGLLMPRPRDRAIELDLPEGGNADAILAAANATIQAMASGEITPDEALTVTRVLDFRLKAMAAAAREAERVRSQLHQQQPSPPQSKEPSPVYGREQGEGLGAPAAQGRRAPSAQPSPQPSPVYGRGSSDRTRGGKFPADLLHSTCISGRPSRSRLP